MRENTLKINLHRTEVLLVRRKLSKNLGKAFLGYDYILQKRATLQFKSAHWPLTCFKRCSDVCGICTIAAGVPETSDCATATHILILILLPIAISSTGPTLEKFLQIDSKFGCQATNYTIQCNLQELHDSCIKRFYFKKYILLVFYNNNL